MEFSLRDPMASQDIDLSSESEVYDSQQAVVFHLGSLASTNV
jgi:hypothetical protein